MKKRHAIIALPWEGYGDVLYFTPVLRRLKSMFESIEVLGLQTEPLLLNPNIASMSNRTSVELDNIRPYNSHDLTMIHVYGYNGLNLRGALPSSGFGHSVIHTTDLHSINALGIFLQNEHKSLEIFWSPDDEVKVDQILSTCHGKVTVISPVITWNSRTLPAEFYQELIASIVASGNTVLITGKDVTYAKEDSPKTLYPPSLFPGAINLYNSLTLAQMGCLLSKVDIAITTETFLNPLVGTSKKSWNLYISSLTAPEFRLPWRYGSQLWRTAVIKNPQDFYPASCWTVPMSWLEYQNVPAWVPSVDSVLNQYNLICNAIDRGVDFL